MNLLPTEGQNAAGDSGCDEHVKSAQFVGEDAGNDSTREGGGIEDGSEVEGHGCAHALFVGVYREIE